MNASPVPRAVSGQSIAALVLGILSFTRLSIVAGIPAVVLGVVELRKIRNGRIDPAGKPFATAGVVLGSVSTALALIAIVVAVWFQAMFAGPILKQISNEIPSQGTSASSPNHKSAPNSSTRKDAVHQK